MIGDLSVRPAPAVEPGLNVRSGPDRVTAAAEVERRARTDRTEPSGGADDPAGVEVDRLRSMLTDPELRVQTQHDPASGRTVMQFQDRATGEVVEQLPSETLLKLYAAIRQPLVDEQV